MITLNNTCIDLETTCYIHFNLYIVPTKTAENDNVFYP
jgi:hypothetical protein